jgi:hypothetical protein
MVGKKYMTKDNDYFELSQAELDTLDEKQAARQQREVEAYIYRKITEATSEVLEGYSEEEAKSLIHEAVGVALHHKIARVQEDILPWCWLRLHAGFPFYEEQPWKEILEEPLIHPDNKAKNIITAFKMAAEKREIL